ncbi:MAG: AAA family ATPase [Candidatus Aenigmatarchaeota archaeon]
MKIGIIGTFNTGKTSLCHSLVGALKEKGVRAEFVPESVRNCPMPAGTEGNSTLDSQMWIIAKQVANEMEAEHNNDVIVCDSNIVNIYAYFLSILKNTPNPKEEFVSIAKSVLEEWHKTYDFLFKLTIPKEKQMMITNDGFRSVNLKWQKEIDVLIDQIISSLGIKVYEIPLDSNLERVRKIMRIIEENKPF